MRKAVVLVLLVLPVLAVIAWFSLTPRSDGVDAFLEQHWRYPIRAQGMPPQGFSELEASLDPAACGQCHEAQYRQWQGSLHSQTMGPGIRWQLQLADADTAKSCLRCHAPMSEQLALQWQERGWSVSKTAPPAHIPTQLHRQGLVCAACHLRGHTRYGPPTRKQTDEAIPHDGFVEQQAYSDSRFCANCHQFAEDGPRLNGKLREDTLQQWLATRYPEEGTNCQSCHMPDRQHLWKGIHDQELTRSALKVTLDVDERDTAALSVRATVQNAGAGHHFPTYLVPEVLLRLEYVAPAGEVVELSKHTLAWRANLTLTEELFDNRLAAGEQLTLSARSGPRPTEGLVRLRVNVSPREHYLRTFENYLQANRNALPEKVLATLREAIDEAGRAKYEFIAKSYVLQPIAN